MELSISTPTLLFSGISLVLLAFTNRFLALAQLIRNLHSEYKLNPTTLLHKQIKNIRLRLRLIRTTQVSGMSSMLLCVVSMIFIYFRLSLAADICFALALLLMMLSLMYSIWEIQISVHALDTHLSDIEEKNDTD